MDYEKEYNEMVQRCKELHESGNALTKQQMEIVCPQLAESEDEKIRKWIIAHLASDDSDKLEEAFAWLEKQKEQKDWAEEMNTKIKELHRQCIAQLKPVEWSEEDEKVRRSIIDGIKNLWPYDHRNKCIDWLKSLRPQPHWKPSKEQMEILSRFNDPVLKSLYNDLKKL